MTKTVSREIEHNGVLYKGSGDRWAVMSYGTYGPSCRGMPSYRYISIPTEKVPTEVLNHD